MTSNSNLQIQCPACGELNDAGSRFCRHCGTALESKPSESLTAESKPEVKAEAQAEPKIEAHAPMTAPVVTPLPAAPTPVAPAPNNSYDGSDEERSSPAEIDARRARQLLERSLYLSERGDSAGAILACRQSVALAPTAPGGYSMLGLLLERTGDLPRAITAYEKAVQLAPSSTLEKESLARLREKVEGQKGVALFHFDDAELFGEGKDGAKKAAAVAVVVPVVAATIAAEAIAEDEGPLPNIGVFAPGLPHTPAIAAVEAVEKPKTPHPAANTPANFDIAPNLATSLSAQLNAISPPMATALAIEERRASDRRRTSIPVVQERRFKTERRTPTAAAAAAGTAAAAPAPIYIAGLNNGAKRPAGTWDTLWQRPSFYGRTLPLMGTTVLCVGFLLWAHGWAVARAAANSEIAAAPGTELVTPTDPAPAGVQPQAGNPGNMSAAPPLTATNPNNGGFPITNGNVSSQQPVANNGGARPAGVVGGGGGTTPRMVSVPKGSPSFPNIIAPAAIPSGAGTTTAPSNPTRSGGGSAGIGLGGPSIPQPVAVEPPSSVIPIGSGPSGGPLTSPLNPAGSSGRGYVRITQGHIGTSALPSRPAAQAGNDERDAANASRAGQSDRAISSLGNAINSDASDAGFRFQQRATLFLERGDYSRAAQDFQSAISAYNEQILRGEQVAAAQAGVRAARSGLNLALAGHQ